MKLNHKIQDEIATALYMYEQGIAYRLKLESDEGMRKYLSGKIDGLRDARMILNAWNEPNHGNTTPQLNRKD